MRQPSKSRYGRRIDRIAESVALLRVELDSCTRIFRPAESDAEAEYFAGVTEEWLALAEKVSTTKKRERLAYFFAESSSRPIIDAAEFDERLLFLRAIDQMGDLDLKLIALACGPFQNDRDAYSMDIDSPAPDADLLIAAANRLRALGFIGPENGEPEKLPLSRQGRRFCEFCKKGTRSSTSALGEGNR